MSSPYVIACAQTAVRTAFRGGSFSKEILEENVDHCSATISSIAAETGAKLIVFPQFCLTGYAVVELAEWIDASVHIPGPETARIAAAAQAAGAYVAISVTEKHASFPGRYFSSVAVIAPDQSIALVHRKNYVLTTRTRPIDVADAFVKEFGEGAFFPVVDTPLGRLGVAVAGEVYWPEAVRALTLRGAEIILNPSSAPPLYYNQRPAEPFIRPVRAFENLAYLAFVNAGGMRGEDGTSSTGPDWPPSEIFDYRGARIGIANPGGDQVASATIDLAGLRSAREEPLFNLLAQRQSKIERFGFGEPSGWPLNAFASSSPISVEALKQLEKEVWTDMNLSFAKPPEAGDRGAT